MTGHRVHHRSSAIEIFFSTITSVERIVVIHPHYPNYQKHILRYNVHEKCRLCGNPNETIEHIIDGCKMLAQREYTRRHNDVCGIIHKQIALNLGLLQDEKSYYRYVPVPVLENDHYLLHWDMTTQTDHLVVHNRPDIVL